MVLNYVHNYVHMCCALKTELEVSCKHLATAAVLRKYDCTVMRLEFAVNISVGTIGSLLVGRYKLLPQISMFSYLHFLMEELSQLRKGVLLAVCQT
jgi:hypothetical protein